MIMYLVRYVHRCLNLSIWLHALNFFLEKMKNDEKEITNAITDMSASATLQGTGKTPLLGDTYDT